MRALEEALWLELGVKPDNKTSVTFIVGAPRTGSTVYYQQRCQKNAAYFANITNDFFSAVPTVGLQFQAAHGSVPIPLHSRFGHTSGLWQPNEGTDIFTHWFGNRQPGEKFAVDFLAEARREHFLYTFATMEKLFDSTPVVKNAWNCFRIPLLAYTLPNACFIWVKRDIAAAARSDLEARCITKKSPLVWNACHPADVAAIKERPYWEQVVENQLAYNLTIKKGLQSVPATQKRVWQYEEEFTNKESIGLSSHEVRAIEEYASAKKFAEFRWDP